MSSVNKVMLLGNLGGDPELRYTQGGQPVCSFNIATSERSKSPTGDEIEKTEWHSIVVWGKTAENCSKYLKKGRTIFVEGRLQTDTWEKEGQKHYKTKIVAYDVRFMPQRQQASEELYAPPVADEFGYVP